MLNPLQFHLHGLLNIISGVYSLGIGLVVFSRNPTSALHRRFLMLAVPPALWMICFGLLSMSVHPNHAEQWLVGAYLVGVPFISPGVFAFSEEWSRRGRPWLIYLGYGMGLVFALVMAFFHRHILSFHDFSWGRFDILVPGAASRFYFVSFMLFFFGYAFLSFDNFRKRLKDAVSPIDRAQAQNLLVGMIIAYSGAVDFLTVFGVPVYPFGYLSVTALMTIIAYTIVQHEAFQIKILAKRAGLLVLIYVLLALFIVPIGLVMFDRLIEGNADSVKTIALAIALISGLLFSSGPLIYAMLVKRTYWLRGHHTMGLVHELKSPLNTIESATDFLSSQVEKGSLDLQKLKSYLSMIDRNTTRLQNFINSLLTVARESGDLRIQKEPFDFGAMVRTQVAHYEPLAAQKGLTLQIEGGDLPMVADAERLAHVISNLLSNAIKFSASGTITIAYQYLSNGEVLCSVQDQGRGLTPEQQTRIFDRFFQLDQNQSGTGIGLTIARIWVEAHAGRLWAESPGPSQGTKFCFLLPTK